MIFEIDGSTGLTSHIQSLLYEREEIQITIEGSYHFQAIVRAISVDINQFGKIEFIVETGELVPSSKNYKKPRIHKKKIKKL